MQYVRSTSTTVTEAGFNQQGCQIDRCAACGLRRTERSASASRGYCFPDEIIALAVRWYVRFRLSSSDVAELRAERGIVVDASTICDGVQHVPPLYQEAAHPHRYRVSCRWSVDETYLRMAGKWVYVYRAIDDYGQVIDVPVSETLEQPRLS